MIRLREIIRYSIARYLSYLFPRVSQKFPPYPPHADPLAGSPPPNEYPLSAATQIFVTFTKEAGFSKC